MNGPEHYRQAEMMLVDVKKTRIESEFGLAARIESEFGLAGAQVHATLALAAATVDNGNGARNDRHAEQWNEVVDGASAQQ